MTAPTAAPHTPDLESLSAWLDGELPAAEGFAQAAHLAACPACAACLDELQALATDLRALPQESLGCDLADVIASRLAARVPASGTAANASSAGSTASAPSRFLTKLRKLFPARHTAAGWWPLGAGAGAAASLALGVALGSALLAGDGAPPPRVAPLAVFDALPPGSLCIGLESCYFKETAE